MKRMIICFTFMFLAIMFSNAMANPPLFIESSKKGCYEYLLSFDGNPDGGIVVNLPLSSHLLNKKDYKTFSEEADIDRNATAIGKSLYGRLMKIPEVSMLLISYRKIIIFKYPYPSSWPEVEKSVIETLDSVLCTGEKK